MSEPTESGTGEVTVAGPDVVAIPAEELSMELLISLTLRSGVAASLTLVVLGTILTFVHHPEYLSDSAALEGLRSPKNVPHDFAEILDGLRALQGRAIVDVGLLVLIATPVLRVALSFVAFLRARNRAFTVLAGLVLVLLAVALAMGKAGA